ncbi:sodium:solute symporter [uncultured Paraglaciecola sp.]|uniref:sodium:solute symporter n=1 Tax=uncultured Paraglaciecola sp. TaxID=1765024 RepID=UPI0030D7480F
MNQTMPNKSEVSGLRFALFSRTLKPFLTLVFMLMVSLGVKAENLVAVTIEHVKPLPSDVAIAKIWTYQQNLVAVDSSGSIWSFDQTTDKWDNTEIFLRGLVKGTAISENSTYLLMADPSTGWINRVEPFRSSDHPQSYSIPILPEPFKFAAASILDEKLFVVGTSAEGSSKMLALDLSSDNAEWQNYPVWSGEGIVTSVIAQTDRLQVTLKQEASNEEQMWQWLPKDGWQERSSLQGNVIEGTARPMGQGHTLYLVSSVDASSVKLMSFQTITGAWAELKRWDNHGTLFGTGWEKGILWVTSKNNQNGTQLGLAQVQSRQNLLSLTDWVILVVYLIAMLGMGLYFYLKQGQSSESNFFLGGRSIPFWAAGISIYASNASSISYIAVPAKAFATNWQYLMSNMILVLGLIFVAIWIVPLLRRLNLISVFHYLETRFHPSIRVISSILFIVFQLGGRMTVILYLPSLALSTVTGLDITMCILVMGFVTIGYTVLGGMKAVIWTDVLQLFVMFGGTIFAIVFILMKLDGGTAEFISSAFADDKFKMVDFSFNLTDATIWGFLFLVFFDTVLTFPKDQVLMQRVFSTSSAKQAGRSMWTFSAIVIPGSAMFYLIGTALYVFYQANPGRMDPSLSLDATFPLFISAELPVGITGLIIAGIFAAAMSTLSSILNSVATVSTVDFYEKWFETSDEKTNVRFAEVVTVVAGLIGIALALLLASYNVNSLLDVALELWGLLGGGFAGAYTLGMFTKRANWQGVIVGVTVSFIVTFMAWTVDLVHPYFYMPLSVFVCIVVGYTSSWFFPAPERLEGLTIYADQEKSKVQAVEQ